MEMKKVARIYCRVSTADQNLNRQLELKDWAEKRGFYVAKVYAESVSGRTSNRSKLKEMLADLQNGETVIAENIDRLSRLPLSEAEKLIGEIKSKGAKILLPNVLDFPELNQDKDSLEAIIFNAMQDLLMKILLKSASDDYELRRERQKHGIAAAKQNGRKFGRKMEQKRIDDVYLCRNIRGMSISETATLLNYSESNVKRISRMIRLELYKPSKKALTQKNNGGAADGQGN